MRYHLRSVVKSSLLTFLGVLFTASLVNATIIAATDFNGRVVSGATASNLNWTANGVSAPGNLTTDAPDGLFNTAAAQNRFAVDRNLHTEGDWTVNIGLNVLATHEIALGLVALDAFIYNNSGALQTVQRDLDLKFSLLDSAMSLIAEKEILNIYANTGAVSQPQNLSFDFSGNTLLANNMYYLKLTAFGQGPGNNAGIDNLVVNGELNSVPVPEPATLLLLGVGMACLAGGRVRGKK